MAWTDLEFDFGSILTSSNMTNLQANFQAMADGDSGAPEITKDALKIGTGNPSGTVPASGRVDISMEAFCFFPNIYASGVVTRLSRLEPYSTNDATYAGKFGMDNTAGGVTIDYDVDFQYITASDKPFIYFIRDKKTGELLHTWWCDDPPPGYWHLSDKEKHSIESGDSFNWPIRVNDWDDSTHESFTKFDYPDGMEVFREWTAKAKSDKSHFHKHMTKNFDFDTDTKLFKPKNITEI